MLEIIAFCCGALVMVLEMVGARVLAPHVGTSAVVWTSLIGVVLACLAVGAWLGGRLADRHLSRRGLAFILTGASLGSALAAGTHRLVGEALSVAITDIHLAAVACALGILALPALCCGMISPYIIRLRIRDVATSGATVGRLYALSTAGSIVGTFLGASSSSPSLPAAPSSGAWPWACCCFRCRPSPPVPGGGWALCCCCSCWLSGTGSSAGRRVL